MAVAELELRVAALETELARLKERVEKSSGSQGDWLDDIYGVFTNDPIYEEAMRLGREYRESLRPKAPRKLARKATNKRLKGRRR
jgi:hypothetical protein